MSGYLWSFDQLARLTRFEDAEVRYWAADRLVHLYPERAAEVLAGLLFDDHDSTPALVAGHLGTHGRETHFPVLLRGFRKGSGSLAGHCLEALARLGSPEAPALARESIHRRDLGEESLARIVGGLCEMQAFRDEAGEREIPQPLIDDAADAAREMLMRRPELYAETPALHGCFRLFGKDQIGDLAGRWITALHFRGIEGAEAGVRVFQEHLGLEEISWCLRTDRSGRVDLGRSLRAIENGYDCEMRAHLPSDEYGDLEEAFGLGAFQGIVGGLAALVERRAKEQAAREGTDRDDLPRMIASLAAGLSEPAILREAEQLGQALHTWLVSLLLSALFKCVVYRDLARECLEAGDDFEKLLELAEVESSSLVRLLPPRLASAAGDANRERLEHWCVATLEARGPFFPKVIALETIGEMRLAGHLPLLLGYVAEDNGYFYGAAERSLLRMGDDAVETVRAELEKQKLHPDAMHSVLHVLADLMTPAALALALDYFDEFMETAGPEDGAELMALFGARELIPYLRRHLQRAAGFPSRIATQARVGHALLLLGAIHNVAIPEEDRILQTIDEYWMEGPDGPSGGTGPSGGSWVM
ncbi:MAG TPA: hypothetical protein VNI57_14210 [Candidatus Saccharimonadales bacterium]|nr:hypothetical protein [Candidatus Saccharimonadales bacterium]